jgi:uncharacterized membrane protein (UPF0127 family)
MEYKMPQSFFKIVILLYFVSIFSLPFLFTMDFYKIVYALKEGNNTNSSSVAIKDLNIYVDLAKTPDQQSKGLSIKNTLNENEGMLFLFDTPKKYSFWMKDMKFPIDIIWINSNYEIVHVEKNLQPCIFFPICTSYSPSEDSKYVLEVTSNYTTKNNITVGDKVNFDINNFTSIQEKN